MTRTASARSPRSKQQQQPQQHRRRPRTFNLPTLPSLDTASAFSQKPRPVLVCPKPTRQPASQRTHLPWSTHLGQQGRGNLSASLPASRSSSRLAREKRDESKQPGISQPPKNPPHDLRVVVPANLLSFYTGTDLRNLARFLCGTGLQHLRQWQALLVYWINLVHLADLSNPGTASLLLLASDRSRRTEGPA